ncbi:MAG: hypothetical protein ACK2TV_13110 [Anaerolineales bacterium]
MREFSSQQKRLKGGDFLPEAAPPPKEGLGNEARRVSFDCEPLSAPFGRSAVAFAQTDSLQPPSLRYRTGYRGRGTGDRERG